MTMSLYWTHHPTSRQVRGTEYLKLLLSAHVAMTRSLHSLCGNMPRLPTFLLGATPRESGGCMAWAAIKFAACSTLGATAGNGDESCSCSMQAVACSHSSIAVLKTAIADWQGQSRGRQTARIRGARRRRRRRRNRCQSFASATRPSASCAPAACSPTCTSTR